MVYFDPNNLKQIYYYYYDDSLQVNISVFHLEATGQPGNQCCPFVPLILGFLRIGSQDVAYYG
jgi:hypothetical protein